ncbi:MAG: SusD/RagB family nutrient-binding outer membrane lipoprotein [Bacteroidota bacterium]|nr:SusD/RagB family nutrient-binding outer membrane lipoprotein [Bacteroidota bacterium]
MKFSIKILPVILAIICLFTACNKDFEEMNTDPNRPKEVYPGALLSQMQYKFVNTSIGAAKNFTHEVMQVTAPRSSRNNGLHRYVVTDATGTGVWNNFYSYVTDVEDLIEISERLNENNYKAIALIYKSWAYSILTDCFGDIPYSQATKATEGIFKPEFDSQKEIYVSLLEDLETANSIIDLNKGISFGGDVVYHATSASGMQNWKKFANSLRLRLLLRLEKRDDELNVYQQINTILSSPEIYPLFTENEDDAIFRYPGSFPFYNPYFNARTVDWSDGVYFTKYFINHLNATEDPRRAIWSTTIKIDGANVYRGIESGYESDVEYVVRENSSYHDNLKTLPQLGVMMTYAEIEFIKAELALKGFNTGSTPGEHYNKGIESSMEQWDATMPAGFLEKEGIAYDPSASTENQMQQIMLQKYFALFFNDYQMWFEKRRTGYPVLPRGTGIPAENQFPSRILYPLYLQSLNSDNLEAAVLRMGGDRSEVKVWWEK